ncbi:MAG: asparaginase [Magnetococcales bacterium]|nr:asparaginase [Magnetococcales bacterium]
MADRKKICLIYTGGTIGMIHTPGRGLHLPEHADDFLRIAPELADLVDYDFVHLLNKDSTNMNPEDWGRMAHAVQQRLSDDYDGFVIAHGTDTMHYSSSALAFVFGKHLDRPIVFTGAQTIPNILHGDARINLLRACQVAIDDLAEVVISYGDAIFRGCRVQKKDEKRFDAFESPAFHPIGYIGEKIELTPSAIRRPDRRHGPGDIRVLFSNKILWLTLIPGLRPELFMQSIENPACEGVVLQSFGAGNVPYEEEHGYSFIPLIKKAVGLHKPVIITSPFPGHGTDTTIYESGLVARQAGAIATGNMTSAAAYVKFSWILGQIAEDIKLGKINKNDIIDLLREKMHEIVAGEMDNKS